MHLIDAFHSLISSKFYFGNISAMLMQVGAKEKKPKHAKKKKKPVAADPSDR